MNLPNINGNYIDLLIILVIIFFISEGFRHGFWVILADFLSFSLSLLLSLRFYQLASGLLRSNFSLSASVSNALGFLFTAIISEAVLGIFLGRLIFKIPEKYWKKSVNKPLSILPALGEALVIISFILTLILGLPVSSKTKADVSDSRIGGIIVLRTQRLETKINEIFGGVVEDSLTYLTIKPGSKERLILTTEVGELEVNEKSEAEMFALVNDERKKQGVKELIWDSNILPVARSHAKDMWERKYFSHFSPEGEDVGDRLNIADIDYFIVGENLALAPTVATAHTGLMNSEGHRANILEKQFERVAIGVIDNGIYGKMFVQIFIK